MSTVYPNNCLQESVLPQLSKMVAASDRSKSLRGASQRSFTQLKSKPLSQFHDTYRQAFKARMFNPQQEYASAALLPGSTSKDLFMSKGKRVKYGHLDRAITNRIGFIYSSLKLIEEHLAETVRDNKLMAHIAQLFKFMDLLTEQISRSVSSIQQKLAAEQDHSSQLKSKLVELQKDNTQLFDYNQLLIRYEKGVNQLKLSHENDKLRLEVQQLTRVLNNKQNTIEELAVRLTEATAKNEQYDSYKSGIDIKLNKLKEQLQLSQHTRQQNLAMKMKYLLGID